MPLTAAVMKDGFNALRGRVNDRLEEYLQLDSDCPEELRKAMAYSLLGGGKRLRPVLALLACEACGGEIEAALPAACAVEMVHTYSLIHDDLPAMDDDALRRGRPTCHVEFGEAMAILAGDGLLTLAFEVLARDVHPPEAAAACCADLAAAAGVCGMVGGQVADLQAAGASNATLAQLEAVHRRKTGRMFAASLTLGARCAGADEETIGTFRTFGNRVGLAFQIADDLLDVSGDAELVGKGVRKDADRGKVTYPALLGVEESRRRAAQLVQEGVGHLARLGDRGRRLESLAQFVIERDH